MVVLGGTRVCKAFFLKTFDISNKRLRNVVVKKKEASSDVAPRDKRGKKEPANKIPKERVDIIEELIEISEIRKPLQQSQSPK
ncbi:hypothetical protein J6590_105147 [Homalodisca vitripennis]|nr:hypothetical protein J6590_105147 [Homalodisca vitripennis]